MAIGRVELFALQADRFDMNVYINKCVFRVLPLTLQNKSRLPFLLPIRSHNRLTFLLLLRLLLSPHQSTQHPKQIIRHLLCHGFLLLLQHAFELRLVRFYKSHLFAVQRLGLFALLFEVGRWNGGGWILQVSKSVVSLSLAPLVFWDLRNCLRTMN